MKTISKQLQNAFLDAREKDYDHIVIAIDLHDTIINSDKYNKAISSEKEVDIALFSSLFPQAVKALQKMSLRKDIQLMLFSGTKVTILQHICRILHEKFGIEFEHINEYVTDDPIPMSSQSFRNKPYYSIIWDDKGGFDPTFDWEDVINTIGNYSVLTT